MPRTQPRREHLSIYARQLADILNHCCYSWNKLIDPPWRILSIGLRDWAHEL
jgi:hypothetical protein